MLGLVLTAGGARGAYQAGVMKRLGEIPSLRRGPAPFQIITGASAGAINGTMLAATGHRFGQSTRALAALWGALTVDRVFRTDVVAMSRVGARLVRDLALGGVFGGGTLQSFFDASPLREFLGERLHLSGIEAAIRRGELYAVAISATSYHSGKAFTFVQGRLGHPIWQKSRRVTVPTKLTLDHVLASAAIPILFPPVLVTTGGECYFGDGALRLVTPFSPAIRLGATRIFGVGVRSSTAAQALTDVELGRSQRWNAKRTTLLRPPLSQICGVFLNAIFLDHLDADLDHLQRMNQLIEANPGVPPGDGTGLGEPMRTVKPMIVSPSEDLALVAKQFEHKMPRVVRYVLDGLGEPNAESADLMSYLLFDKSYTQALIEIGYNDADLRVDEIEGFLLSDRAPAARASGKVAVVGPTPPAG
jgi:NTE family protein